VFLERKLRKPGLLIKRRTIAAIDSLERFQSQDVPAGWDGEWFHRRLLLRQLAPSCQVSYHRMARVLPCPDGMARLTLDSALRATPSRHASFSHEGVPFLEHGLILELKYHRYLPALFRRLVEEFSLEIGTASKYRLAMTALGHAPVETGAVHA
jgi:hypothetical protein